MFVVVDVALLCSKRKGAVTSVNAGAAREARTDVIFASFHFLSFRLLSRLLKVLLCLHQRRITPDRN